MWCKGLAFHVHSDRLCVNASIGVPTQWPPNYYQYKAQVTANTKNIKTKLSVRFKDVIWCFHASFAVFRSVHFRLRTAFRTFIFAKVNRTVSKQFFFL